MGYAKLFASITESSLWSEPKEVRLLFVTMLAKANSVGFVEASIPGLSRAANLTVEEVQSAIPILENPDPFSKNPACEGRRIIPAPGGWLVLNYEEYRSRQSEDERREYMREYMRNYRKQSVNNVKRNKEFPSASSSVSVSGTEEGIAKGRAHPDSQDEVEAFCVSIGLLASDGEAMWLDWQERGFGKTRDWKSKIKKWKIHGYHPSQKIRSNQNGEMSPQHRQNRINYLNEKKRKINRQIKDPQNPPSWATKELALIDKELREL